MRGDAINPRAAQRSRSATLSILTETTARLGRAVTTYRLINGQTRRFVTCLSHARTAVDMDNEGPVGDDDTILLCDSSQSVSRPHGTDSCDDESEQSSRKHVWYSLGPSSTCSLQIPWVYRPYAGPPRARGRYAETSAEFTLRRVRRRRLRPILGDLRPALAEGDLVRCLCDRRRAGALDVPFDPPHEHSSVTMLLALWNLAATGLAAYLFLHVSGHRTYDRDQCVSAMYLFHDSPKACVVCACAS